MGIIIYESIDGVEESCPGEIPSERLQTLFDARACDDCDRRGDCYAVARCGRPLFPRPEIDGKAARACERVPGAACFSGSGRVRGPLPDDSFRPAASGRKRHPGSRCGGNAPGVPRRPASRDRPFQSGYRRMPLSRREGRRGGGVRTPPGSARRPENGGDRRERTPDDAAFSGTGLPGHRTDRSDVRSAIRHDSRSAGSRRNDRRCARRRSGSRAHCRRLRRTAPRRSG